jgi:predicted Zn-dependent peptidase
MKFKKHTLPNGLRIITVPMKDNPTVTVLVLVETGSKYENSKNKGISHFLEHMCFKGTSRRPRALDISKELDALGSQYNAFTGHEYTGYYAKSAAKHFSQILDVVSDIYLHSTFPEKEMEKEKNVIIEEINMYQDLPQKRVGDVFFELLYGDQPAGWNIAGTKESVKKMKRSDFLDYQKDHYVAEATTVIVAGNIGEKKAVHEIKKAFAPIRAGRKKGKLKVSEKQKKPAIKLEFKQTDQSHLVLGVRTFNILDKRIPVLSVLSGILGGGMSSRLFQKLREEMAVCYYVRASSDAFTDHGFLEVSAGVDNKRISEVIRAILEELRKMRSEEVGKEELEKVKEYLIGNLNLELESSDSLANFFGGQEILKKKIETAKEIAEKIRRVTARDIKNLANQIFKNQSLNLAVVGPFKNGKMFRPAAKF